MPGSDSGEESDERATFLVLCTHNSCRSQAEAFLREKLGDRMPAASAGMEPVAEIHPLTVEVMREKGSDLSEHRPKHCREFLGKVSVHTIAIVCAGAAAACPSIWPGAMHRIESPFADPTVPADPGHRRLRDLPMA